MGTERVIVHREVAGKLIKALISEFSEIKSGGPGEQLGAQFSEGSAENIVSMIREAQAEGAVLLVGDGTRVGSVVQPHLITGVKPGTRLWERESFGPGKCTCYCLMQIELTVAILNLVLVLAEVDTIDEAVQLANASEYSLVASLWTRDVHVAMDVSMRVRTGSSRIDLGYDSEFGPNAKSASPGCMNVNGPTVHLEHTRDHTGLG